MYQKLVLSVKPIGLIKPLSIDSLGKHIHGYYLQRFSPLKLEI